MRRIRTQFSQPKTTEGVDRRPSNATPLFNFRLPRNKKAALRRLALKRGAKNPSAFLRDLVDRELAADGIDADDSSDA